MDFTNRVVVTADITITYTENDIDGIMVGAIEGGINYWAFVSAHISRSKDRPEGMPVSQWCTRLLLDGKSVFLKDKEDPEELFELTLDKLRKGIQMNAKHYGTHDVEQMDAGDYDRIIQLALFDDIIYG